MFFLIHIIGFSLICLFNMDKEYLEKMFIKSNHPKYYKFCQKIEYFVKDKERIIK